MEFRGWDLQRVLVDSNNQAAVACAFDLLMLDGDDLRRRPLAERKAALRKVLKRTKDGIQYVEHVEGDGAEMFAAVCKLGLEGIASKKLDSLYRSGPSKSWIKVKNPKVAAATRALDGRSGERKRLRLIKHKRRSPEQQPKRGSGRHLFLCR